MKSLVRGACCVLEPALHWSLYSRELSSALPSCDHLLAKMHYLAATKEQSVQVRIWDRSLLKEIDEEGGTPSTSSTCLYWYPAFKILRDLHERWIKLCLLCAMMITAQRQVGGSGTQAWRGAAWRSSEQCGSDAHNAS